MPRDLWRGAAEHRWREARRAAQHNRLDSRAAAEQIKDGYRPKLHADIDDPSAAKGKGQAFIYLKEGYWVAKKVNGEVRITNECGFCDILHKLKEDGTADIMAVFIKRWIEDYPEAPDWQVMAAKKILIELD